VTIFLLDKPIWLASSARGCKVMKLAEVIEKVSWAETKACLLWNYADAEKSMAGYERVFCELRKLQPTSTSMRIFIRKTFREGLDDEPFTEVVGKNGTLNKELEDFKYLNKSEDSEYANSEIEYALDFHPWEEWLGMEVDTATHQKYAYPEILAHCLWEMTFMGFDQDTIREEKQELERRAAELKSMTEEERKQKLIPLQEMTKRLEKRKGEAGEPKS